MSIPTKASSKRPKFSKAFDLRSKALMNSGLMIKAKNNLNIEIKI